MTIIQFLLISFFAFAFAYVFFRWWKKDIKIKKAGAWMIFWLVGVVVVLKPDITMPLAKMVGIGRGADLVVYIALSILFYLFFRFWVRLEKLESNLTKLVRHEALRNREDK